MTDPTPDDAPPTPPFSDDEVKRISEELIQNRLITPDRLYVDLALLKDLALGAMLALAFRDSVARAKQVYDIIAAGLPAYRTRYFFDPLYYFKETGYTQAELDQALHDPHLADDIYRMAPMTGVIKTLLSHMLVNANHSAVAAKEGDVTMLVNTYPLQLSPTFQGALMVYLGEILHVNTTMCNQSIAEMPFAELQACDEFYLYHIHEFSHHPDVHRALSELTFTNKRIFAIPTCGYTYDPLRSRDSLAQELVQVEAAMGVATETFRHIPVNLCSPVVESSPTPDPATAAAATT